MRLVTIGFTKRTAESFFHDLQNAGVQQVIDVRLNSQGQLAGFAKGRDLPYFLSKLVGASYRHEPRFAPTDELLRAYMAKTGQRKKTDGRAIDWPEYEVEFRELMEQRGIPATLDRSEFEPTTALLCSEATPERCHRRLVAEAMAEAWGDLEVVHL